ncbi:hypothetical protein ACIQU5_35795 [Streptomyces sp. NPDC090306]|uniref:hypothetical protein n=1 Tax=Streptomyces sp. NPDC090306 TaxID=3365961 RepID=UPI00382DB102
MRGEVTVRTTPEERHFLEELLSLWRTAGSPSRNEWGDEASLSPRTIAAYLDGKTLPTVRKFDQLIEGLARLCLRNEENLGTWVRHEGDAMREEHLHVARIARKAARQKAHLFAQALPGGQPDRG